jgi:hypothetical protein
LPSAAAYQPLRSGVASTIADLKLDVPSGLLWGLERDHYDLVFYALAVKNAARYTAAEAQVRAKEALTGVTNSKVTLEAADGGGADVLLDPAWAEKSLAALAECIRRHGALEQVTLAVDGAAVSIGPVADGVGAIALGDDLKDFGAAVGSRVLDAMGAELKVEGERLVVRLPQA